MKEQEYINVRELSHVTCAKQNLDYIISENSVVIPDAELKTVKRLLSKWEIGLYKIIKIKS